jgi:hypothetical protein
MLNDDVFMCILTINYMMAYEKSVDFAMDRILYSYIYDPISRVSPMGRVSQIREALASDEKLSEIGVAPAHRRSEENCRALLVELADRIEAIGPSAPPEFQKVNDPSERQLEELRILVQPLAETSALSDAIKTFAEKVLPDLRGFVDCSNAEALIRYALRCDSNQLQSMVAPPVTDSALREYLRNIAWIIEDHARRR